MANWELVPHRRTEADMGSVKAVWVMQERGSKVAARIVVDDDGSSMWKVFLRARDRKGFDIEAEIASGFVPARLRDPAAGAMQQAGKALREFAEATYGFAGFGKRAGRTQGGRP